MKMPGVILQSTLEKRDYLSSAGGKWVCARPLPYYSLRNRLRATWLVFTGQADALIWDLFNKERSCKSSKE